MVDINKKRNYTQLLHKVEDLFKLKKNSVTNYIMKKNSGNQLHNGGGEKIYYVLGHNEGHKEHP